MTARLFLAGKFLPNYVEAVLASRRLPPKATELAYSRHSFVKGIRNGGLDFSKPPFPIGVLIGLLHDGFFSFAVVRQLDNRLFLFLRIIIKSKCHRNVRTGLSFDRKIG